MCLETSLHAGFGIDIDVLGNSQQPLVKDYRRPFELGERSPMYLKLLQICPVVLQLPAVALISRVLGVDVSGMRRLLEKSLKVSGQTCNRKNQSVVCDPLTCANLKQGKNSIDNPSGHQEG